jgi:hypothetical protein
MADLPGEKVGLLDRFDTRQPAEVGTASAL